MKAAVAGFFLVIAATAYSQQAGKQESPAEHHCSMMKHDEMMKHGDMAMGFSQSETTHHFQLSATGGSIEVQTNDPSDTASREQIRHHLREIAKAFAEGDFSSPMLTHSRVPPGVPDMQRLKGALSYSYVETDRGGKVLIVADSTEVLEAVHEFLRFQIEEHQTKDSETVRK